MKISVLRQEPLKVERESEMKVHLEDTGSNEVKIVADDANGHTWVIAFLVGSGLHIVDSIAASSGWPIDSMGRINVIMP